MVPDEASSSVQEKRIPLECNAQGRIMPTEASTSLPYATEKIPPSSPGYPPHPSPTHKFRRHTNRSRTLPTELQSFVHSARTGATDTAARTRAYGQDPSNPGSRA